MKAEKKGLSHKVRYGLVGAVSALALTCSLGAVSADQGNVEADFNIPEQKLSRALLMLGQQSDTIVVIPRELVGSTMGSAVEGRMSLDDALSRLLDGTGFEYARDAEGGITIVPKSAMNSGSGNFSSASEAGEKQTAFVLEEIIVTAEKRSESVQDIPIAISAYSSDNMKRGGVSTLKDLKMLAPSLQFGTKTFGDISIRGVGQQTSQIGAESGAAVSENGMSFASVILYDSDFLDVARVELLRGPQGTISGRNATGGAINIHSNKPTEEFEGSAKLTIGNYGQFATEGVLSGPLVGEVLGRLAFRTDQNSGWLENTLLDEMANNRNKVQARASFLAPLSETVEAYLILEMQRDRGFDVHNVETGRARTDTPSISERLGAEQNDLENLKFLADNATRADQKKYKSILRLTWDINENSRLTSTTGFAQMDWDIRDEEFEGSGASYEHFPFLDINTKQVSQELTYTADLTDKLDVILGGLYINSKSDEPIDVALPVFSIFSGSIVLLPEQELNSYAVYTQWRYRVTDKLRFTVGARYTSDQKDYTTTRENRNTGDIAYVRTGEATWGSFTPRFAVDYMSSDDTTIYASVSKGYKAGGYNTFGTGPGGGSDEFDPEYIWSYELGMKNYWMDGRLRSAVAGFYMDYTNFQASVRRQIDSGLSNLNVENAASATIKGIEIELEAQVTDGLKFTAAGTWLDATFDEFLANDPILTELNDPVTNVRDLSGHRIPKAPKWQFNVAGEYTAPVGADLNLVLRADYQWQDHQKYDIFNYDTVAHDAYGLLNLYAALETEDGRWQLAASARNVLDERYIVSQSTVNTSTLGVLGEPRMYGVSLAYKF